MTAPLLHVVSRGPDEGESLWVLGGFYTYRALPAETAAYLLVEVIDRGLPGCRAHPHPGRSHRQLRRDRRGPEPERSVLLTALSRLGRGSRVVLTHDVAQRDNLRVGRHDGIVSVIETLKGHPLFAHVTLTRSERSAIAALVTQVLDG